MNRKTIFDRALLEAGTIQEAIRLTDVAMEYLIPGRPVQGELPLPPTPPPPPPQPRQQRKLNGFARRSWYDLEEIRTVEALLAQGFTIQQAAAQIDRSYSSLKGAIKAGRVYWEFATGPKAKKAPS